MIWGVQRSRNQGDRGCGLPRGPGSGGESGDMRAQHILRSEVGRPRGAASGGAGAPGEGNGAERCVSRCSPTSRRLEGVTPRAGASSETPGGQWSPTPRNSEPTCGRHTHQLPRLGRCHSVWQYAGGRGVGGAALAGSRLPSHLPGGLRLVHSCMALARSRVKWESWQQEKEGGCPTELSGSVAGA